MDEVNLRWLLHWEMLYLTFECGGQVCSHWPSMWCVKGWGQRLQLSSWAGRRKEAVIDVGKQRGRALPSPSWARAEGVMQYNVYPQCIHTCGGLACTHFLRVRWVRLCSRRPFQHPSNSHTFSLKCPSIFLSSADANQRWQLKLTALPSSSVSSPFHLT